MNFQGQGIHVHMGLLKPFSVEHLAICPSFPALQYSTPGLMCVWGGEHHLICAASIQSVHHGLPIVEAKLRHLTPSTITF